MSAGRAADRPASGRLVFITGASSGIGQALARAYYLAGDSLALVARRTELIHAFARQENWLATRYGVYAADLAELEQAVAAGTNCIEQQGLPDIVIANAGISVGIDTAERQDLEVMQSVVATNLLGMAATFQPFVKPFVRRGRGRLVGIASVAGIRGLPGHGAYCSSKAAVISYCESLRGELRQSTGPDGVRVVTLLPGYIATPLTRGNRFPMPFLLSADEFARAALGVIERGESYRVIPWQMAWVARLLKLLPDRLFDRLMRGRPRKRRAAE